MYPKTDVLTLLEMFRQRDPNLIADIEVALHKMKEAEPHILLDPTLADQRWLTLARELSYNFFKMVTNNRGFNESVSPREEFQRQELEPHHVARLIEELNKLPSDAPFVQLAIITRQVMNWAFAEKDIGQAA